MVRRFDASSLSVYPSRMSIEIRECDRSHAPAILDILNDAIETSTAVWDYVPRPPASMEAWFDRKERNNAPVLGAFDEDGTLLGFSSYERFRARWAAYKYTVENFVYIHSEHRRAGLGKQLLKALIERAKQQQLHVLVAVIAGDNQASKMLHHGLGFESCGTLKQAGYKFDRWVDMEMYQLILETPENPVAG